MSRVSSSVGAGKRKDVRLVALAWVVLAVVVVGLIIELAGNWPRVWQSATSTALPPVPLPNRIVREQHEAAKVRFQQGVLMLHSKQYEHALVAFHEVLALDPASPDAYVNAGFALLGLQRYGEAADFFRGAIDLRANQLNAYFGLAEALEAQGDLEGAVGAMRTYAHLAPPDDPFQRKSWAALWEWESRLKAQRSAAAGADGAPAPGATPSPANGAAGSGKP